MTLKRVLCTFLLFQYLKSDEIDLWPLLWERVTFGWIRPLARQCWKKAEWTMQRAGDILWYRISTRRTDLERTVLLLGRCSDWINSFPSWFKQCFIQKSINNTKTLHSNKTSRAYVGISREEKVTINTRTLYNVHSSSCPHSCFRTRSVKHHFWHQKMSWLALNAVCRPLQSRGFSAQR